MGLSGREILVDKYTNGKMWEITYFPVEKQGEHTMKMPVIFNDFCGKMIEVHEAKGKVYDHGGQYSNWTNLEKFGTPGWQGPLYRAAEKMERIKKIVCQLNERKADGSNDADLWKQLEEEEVDLANLLGIAWVLQQRG